MDWRMLFYWFVMGCSIGILIIALKEGYDIYRKKHPKKPKEPSERRDPPCY